MRWLGETSTGFYNKLKNILLAFFIYALYIFLYSKFMEFMWAEGVIGIVSTIVIAPVVEEIIFRAAPIGLVKDKPALMFPTIILSSALFGYLHFGPVSWLVQGIMGFILSLIYIKNNYSYWSVVALHALWNSYCVFILEKL